MKKLLHKQLPIYLPIIAGVLCAVIISLLGTYIASALVESGKLSAQNSNWAIPALWILSSGGGALIASFLAQKRILIVCTAVALGYFAVLLGMGMLLFDGLFSGIWMALLSVTVGICPIVAFALLKGNSMKGKKRYSYS